MATKSTLRVKIGDIVNYVELKPYYKNTQKVSAIRDVPAERSPESFKRLGFYVLAPDEQIRAGVFKSKMQRSSILDKVKRRVEAYEGEKETWFKEWFLPTLDRLDIRCISWEEVLDYIKHKDPDAFNEYLDFYNKCLGYNCPEHLSGRPKVRNKLFFNPE